MGMNERNGVDTINDNGFEPGCSENVSYGSKYSATLKRLRTIDVRAYTFLAHNLILLNRITNEGMSSLNCLLMCDIFTVK